MNNPGTSFGSLNKKKILCITVEWLIFCVWVFPFLILPKRGHMFFFSFLIFTFYVDF